MRLHKFLLPVGLAFMVCQGLAETNLKDASFQKSVTDSPGLERSYNSRSLYNGAFGFGWCASFEKKLTVTENGDLILSDCHLPADLIFHPRSNSQGLIFLNASYPKETIRILNKKYTRFINGKITEKYNLNGQLVESTGIKYFYRSNGLPKEIRAESSLFLTWDSPSRKIMKIQVSDGFNINYKYQNENLIQAAATKYQYDAFHNLTRITMDDQSFEEMTYDAEKDWVLSYQSSTGCIETYSYQFNEHQISSILKKCPGQAEKQAVFEFWYATSAKGGRYLQKMKITTNKKSRVTSWRDE